jgi:hypothetical protein
MRYVFLFLILSMAWAADPPEVKLPPDVQKIVDAREAEVAKAKAVYDAAVAKATAAASKNMEVVIKAKMAKQDLEGAVVAKAVVTKWKSEEPDPGDLLGDLNPKLIIGTYKVTSGGWAGITTISIDAKFNATTSAGYAGTATITNGVLLITWTTGTSNSGSFSLDKPMELAGGNGGASVTIVKAK